MDSKLIVLYQFTSISFICIYYTLMHKSTTMGLLFLKMYNLTHTQNTFYLM